MERRRGAETQGRVAVIILFCVLAFPLLAVTGCGKQLARMEENQARLQAMIAANTRDLATISDQLHTGQGKINDSIQTLDGDTQQVAAAVGSVHDDQRQFRTMVAAGHEGLHTRIAQVQNAQQTLQGSVQGVAEVAQHTATDLASLAREHGTLHATVQANQRELTGRLGTVTDTQQQIQTGLGDLRQASTGLARDITSVAAKHDTLYATVQDNDRRLADRLTSLAEGTERVCVNIANVDTLLRRMGTDLAAGHTTLQEQLGASHDGLTAQIASLSTQQQTLQAGVDTLGGKADRTAADLAETRTGLQDTLRVSREVLTGQMAASLQNQQAVHNDVRGLHDKADKLTEHQQSLSEAVKTNHDAVAAGLTGLAEGQAALRDNVSALDARTEALVVAQSAFQQTLQSHGQAVNEGVAQLARAQQALRVQIENLAALAGRTNDSLTGLSDRQVSLQQALQNAAEMLSEKMNRTAAGLSQLGQQQTALQEGLRTGHLALATQATELANHQQTLQKGIDSLVQATQRVAANGAAITAAQDVLQQTLASRSDQATEQMTVVADLQAQMQVNLDTLSAVAGQAALDILALGKGQTDLTQTVKTGVTNLGARADKVAAELTAVAAGQNSLQETWTHQVQTTSGQMARLAANQQQLQNGLDALTATAGQTALDVIAMTTRQEAIQAAVQSHDAAFDAQATTLANGQQQIQNGLDVVTATTGQASLDALALSRGQGQLAQAVQAGRQETAGLLTALSQGQQNWAARLEATQAQIAAVTGNIATLERQVAGLQGLLQTGLQGTTTLLDATDQQRQQFEAKVGRELQAVIESLAQLRQTQASLQDQIAQVHRSTQGQAENLRSVLEQIKTTSSAGGRVAEPLPEVENLTDEPESGQPPADIRIGAVLPQPQASEMTETPVAAK